MGATDASVHNIALFLILHTCVTLLAWSYHSVTSFRVRARECIDQRSWRALANEVLVSTESALAILEPTYVVLTLSVYLYYCFLVV